ncbi:hypothetical protein NIES2104_39520 [Leptolyngbya sp. NIES-2104]|nr:hypothetical protein NIES2104_39520 [Leptolyngbya sp. NIES-2104]
MKNLSKTSIDLRKFRIFPQPESKFSTGHDRASSAKIAFC